MNEVVDQAYYREHRWTDEIGFGDTRDVHAVTELEHLPAVLSAEPVRTEPGRMRANAREERIAVQGFDTGSNLDQPLDMQGRPIAFEGHGVVLSIALAHRLAVRAGDFVELEIMDERRPRMLLPVTAIAAVSDEGTARVREAYVVSSPVGGQLERVPLEVGDRVVADRTVIARIRPAAPEFLDPRSRSQASSAVDAARAAVESAVAQRDRLAAEATRAADELRRESGLAKLGVVSAEQLVTDQSNADQAATRQPRVRPNRSHESCLRQCAGGRRDLAGVWRCDTHFATERAHRFGGNSTCGDWRYPGRRRSNAVSRRREDCKTASCGRVTQLDRVQAFEAECWEFESLRARHILHLNSHTLRRPRRYFGYMQPNIRPLLMLSGVIRDKTRGSHYFQNG